MEIEFEIVPSHAEEVMEASDFIPDLCEANAKKKAEPIAELHPECLVIAADTIVITNLSAKTVVDTYRGAESRCIKQFKIEAIQLDIANHGRPAGRHRSHFHD